MISANERHLSNADRLIMYGKVSLFLSVCVAGFVMSGVLLHMAHQHSHMVNQTLTYSSHFWKHVPGASFSFFLLGGMFLFPMMMCSIGYVIAREAENTRAAQQNRASDSMELHPLNQRSVSGWPCDPFFGVREDRL